MKTMATALLTCLLGLFASLDASPAAAKSLFPLQVAIEVPFAPAAFHSAGATHLVYELYLTNFSPSPVTIKRIEALDADAPASAVLALEGDALGDAFAPVGSQAKPSAVQLAPGSTAIIYLWASLKDGMRVPARLSHRVSTDEDDTVEGAVIAVQRDLPVLGPPVRGQGWLASDGPSNARDNHHRRGVLVLDGKPVDSRRYAIDWMLTRNGQTLTGDNGVRESYFAFGQPVYAVADGIVAHAKDGQPDNTPALPASFHPALPITMDTVAGNNIVLDLGHDHYAYYFHLHPGSLLVKAGDHVRRGQLIGRIGCSGDATVPHLHFEVTTSPKLIAGDGVAYAIDGYRVQIGDGWDARKKELPLDKMVVDFGPER